MHPATAIAVPAGARKSDLLRVFRTEASLMVEGLLTAWNIMPRPPWRSTVLGRRDDLGRLRVGSEQAAMNRLALHPLEDEVSEPESDCIHSLQCCPRCSRLNVRRNVGGLIRWDTVSFAYGRHPSRPSAQRVDERPRSGCAAVALGSADPDSQAC